MGRGALALCVALVACAAGVESRPRGVAAARPWLAVDLPNGLGGGVRGRTTQDHQVVEADPSASPHPHPPPPPPADRTGSGRRSRNKGGGSTSGSVASALFWALLSFPCIVLFHACCKQQVALLCCDPPVRRGRTTGAGLPVGAPATRPNQNDALQRWRDASRRRRNGRRGTQASAQVEEQAAAAAQAAYEVAPLSPDQLSSIPASKGAWRVLDDEETCMICLEAHEADGPDGDLSATAGCARCSSIFHTSCIRAWLAVSGSCPACRAPVRSGDDMVIVQLVQKDAPAAYSPGGSEAPVTPDETPEATPLRFGVARSHSSPDLQSLRADVPRSASDSNLPAPC